MAGYTVHGRLSMQIFGLGAQSGTTIKYCYPSWAGMAATKFHGTQQDSSACFAKAYALQEGEEPCSVYLIYTISSLTLVGLGTSNNKTINASCNIGFVRTRFRSRC